MEQPDWDLLKDAHITKNEAAVSSSLMDWEEFRDNSISLEDSSDYFHQLIAWACIVCWLYMWENIQYG